MIDRPSELPFAAPCRRLPASAPFAWLRAGWHVYRCSLRVSLVYGLAVFAISLAMAWRAWRIGSYILLLAALTGFVFIAPLLATGLYSVSRQLERGETPRLRRTFRRMRAALRDSLLYALILMVIFLVWVRAASMVHVFFPVAAGTDWTALAVFLVVGSAAGSIFALATFASAAFSLPMIVDRNADMITAVVSSINAVLRNKRAMLVWIVSITGLVVPAILALGIGLIVAVPVLGYVAYHGYSETLDTGAWPPAEVDDA